MDHAAAVVAVAAAVDLEEGAAVAAVVEDLGVVAEAAVVERLRREEAAVGASVAVASAGEAEEV